MKSDLTKFLFFVSILFLLFLAAGLLISNSLLRNSDNNISIEEIAVCTMDAKMCPNGSAVGRDGANNCEFFPCPSSSNNEDEAIFCTQDVIECPDGSYVGRDSNNNCAFFTCP